MLKKNTLNNLEKKNLPSMLVDAPALKMIITMKVITLRGIKNNRIRLKRDFVSDWRPVV